MKTFNKNGLVLFGAVCLVGMVNTDAEAHGFGSGFSPHISSLHAFRLSSFKMPGSNAFRSFQSVSGKHLSLGSQSFPHAFDSSNKAAEIEALENKNRLNKAEEMEALENKHLFPEEGMYVTKNKPAEIAALEGKHGQLNPQPLPPVYSPSSTPTSPPSSGSLISEGPDGIGVVRSPLTGGPVTEAAPVLNPANLQIPVQTGPNLQIPVHAGPPMSSPFPELFPAENLGPHDFPME